MSFALTQRKMEIIVATVFYLSIFPRTTSQCRKLIITFAARDLAKSPSAAFESCRNQGMRATNSVKNWSSQASIRSADLSPTLNPRWVSQNLKMDEKLTVLPQQSFASWIGFSETAYFLRLLSAKILAFVFLHELKSSLWSLELWAQSSRDTSTTCGNPHARKINMYVLFANNIAQSMGSRTSRGTWKLRILMRWKDHAKKGASICNLGMTRLKRNLKQQSQLHVT